MIPVKNQVYKIKLKSKFDFQAIDGQLFFNKGTVQELFGKTWRELLEDELIGSFPCINYFLRWEESPPAGDDVLYGVVDGKNNVVHSSELEEVP